MSEIITNKLTGKTAAGNVTITSEGGSATMQLQQGVAKAWVSFNGVGTPAVRNSLNTSSITDTATGDYTAAFTNSMNDSDYAIAGSGQRDGTYAVNSYGIEVDVKRASTHSTYITTSNYAINTKWGNGAEQDPRSALVITHGDLA